jgi:hypothetical protein
LLIKTRQRLSLTDVSGCENPFNQRPAGAEPSMEAIVGSQCMQPANWERQVKALMGGNCVRTAIEQKHSATLLGTVANFCSEHYSFTYLLQGDGIFRSPLSFGECR